MVSDHSNRESQPGNHRALGWWGLLPPLTVAGGHHWLPLSDTALVALHEAILASQDGDGAPDSSVTSRVSQALERDPPLLLFALMRWTSWGGDEWVSATELSEGLVRHATDVFSGGDWILKMPEVTAMHQHHWSRLLAQSLSRPPASWTDDLCHWLSVIGPRVESDALPELPRLIWDLGATSTSATRGSELLHRAAMAKQQTLGLESRFSASVEDRKNSAAKELAYGLSHEINNPLANISARAQQLEHGEQDAVRRESLQQIVQQVYRAHEMIAGLMFYANPPEIRPTHWDLNQMIEEVAEEFAASSAAKGIQVHWKSSAEPATVRADSEMVREAMRILVRNSVEAIGSGGTIVMSIQRSDDDLAAADLAGAVDGASEERGAEVRESEIPPAGWQVHVADSGPGLSPQASRHAFDPFYSGREAGRGLGLGLCRAYRVAQLHGATIRLSGGLAGCLATITIPNDAR